MNKIQDFYNHDHHIYALMGMSQLSGAATSCVGLLGLEQVDGEWVETTTLIPEAFVENDGEWTRRLELSRQIKPISPETATYWQESANGIVWDISEVPSQDYESAQNMTTALDIVLDDILTNPDPDPQFIEWLNSRSE